MTQYRIAFYMTSFEGGGAERNTVLIASELARCGHAVIILVDRETGPNRDLLDRTVEVRTIEGSYAARIRVLRRILRDWRADAVFARLGLCPLIAVIAALGAKGAWKTIISYHNPYDPKTSRGVRLTWWGIAVLSRLSHATFGVSNDIGEQLQRFGAQLERCHVIHNPVDLDWVAARKDDPLPAGFPLERPFLLSVGRLVPQKGFGDLIAAFALIAPETQVDLVILGEGPLEAELRSMVAEMGLTGRVHLAGYLANPFPAYKAARAFVLASHWEGFGNVIVEALACGTHVIATNCPGGPKDILNHGRFGILVPPRDAKALAAAKLRVLETEPDPDANLARARDFELSAVAAKYVALI